MLPASGRQPGSGALIQSSAPADGRDHRPKHVELIGIINKSLLLHLVGCVAGGRQHRGCIIPQAVTHSLVLLKMGEIIARNMLSLLELLINRYCCI
jgi:hypothetical protein